MNDFKLHGSCAICMTDGEGENVGDVFVCNECLSAGIVRFCDCGNVLISMEEIVNDKCTECKS